MWQQRILALSAIFLVSACTSLVPYRTVSPDKSNAVDCTPIADGTVSLACDSQIVEVPKAKNYELYFAEFDDQGRPYAHGGKNGDADQQISIFLNGVNRAFNDPESNGVSVIVFAHGWLHSAYSKDSNLTAFRVLLAQLRGVERAAGCDREVIGLYVGWRGAGTRLRSHPWDTPTFWSRKNAAAQIATGSFLEIPANLRALQGADKEEESPSRADTGSYCGSRLKTTYVGHSFGGLIMISAMSPHLIQEIVLLGQSEQQRQDARRQQSLASNALLADDCKGGPQPNPTATLDELVITINPAIEGARFDSLFRVASNRDLKIGCYRAPKFIAVTSSADWATQTLFPLGRTLNTITKNYPAGDKSGRKAARTAIGHDEQYLTRDLRFTPNDPTIKDDALALCNDYFQTSTPESRIKLEVEAAEDLYKTSGGSYDADKTDEARWPRVFCASWVDPETKRTERGVMVMGDGKSERLMSRNVPVWNIHTDDPIVRNHGDITNPRLLVFLRQIYIDTMFFR